MRFFSFFFLLVFLASCSGEQDAYLKPRNLIEYGIPLTILAPDSVNISKENLGVQNEKGGLSFDPFHASDGYNYDFPIISL